VISEIDLNPFIAGERTAAVDILIRLENWVIDTLNDRQLLQFCDHCAELSFADIISTCIT